MEDMGPARRWWGIFVLAALLAIGPRLGHADEPTLEEWAKTHPPAPASVSVEDFLIDGGFAVYGSAQCLGTMCLLYGANMTSSIFIKQDALPRADRRRLLDCNMFTSPCHIALRGHGKGDILDPFVVEAITWEVTQ